MYWRVGEIDEGVLRVAQGRHAEGLALLTPIVETDRWWHLNAREHAAIATRALGDLPGAIRMLEPVDQVRAQMVVNGDWVVHDWLRCRVLLVELYREAGRHEDADRVAADVRKFLAVADEGHPLLARLRK